MLMLAWIDLSQVNVVKLGIVDLTKVLVCTNRMASAVFLFTFYSRSNLLESADSKRSLQTDTLNLTLHF